MLRCSRFRRLTGRMVPKLPVAHLQPPETHLPKTPEFDLERSGEPKLEDLANATRFIGRYDNLRCVPPPEEFWNAPTHEAWKTIAENSSYFQLLQYVMEHGHTFLFATCLAATDAPLPHQMYEDFMKALTYCSMQKPPEEQFQLDRPIIRSLLCLSAHYVLKDPDYFPRVEAFFHLLDKQQTIGSEGHSAWVLCCAAAGETEQCINFALHMESFKLPMDPLVFALMMHPSVKPTDLTKPDSMLMQKTKGLLAQYRLSSGLQASVGTAAAALHSLFVFHSLTLKHERKWETVRVALAKGIVPSPRTVDLIVETYRIEKGRKCGPVSIKVLTQMLAEGGRISDLAYLLMQARLNEQTVALGLEPCHWEASEVHEILLKAKEANPEAFEEHAEVIGTALVNKPIREIAQAFRIVAKRKEDKAVRLEGDAQRGAATSPPEPSDEPSDSAVREEMKDQPDSAVVGKLPVDFLRTVGPEVTPIGARHEKFALLPRLNLDGSPVVDDDDDLVFSPGAAPEHEVKRRIHNEAFNDEVIAESSRLASFASNDEQRRIAAQETAEARKRLRTAWMNPEAFYR